MKKSIMILLAMGLAGCATSEIIYLKNQAGETVECGPYTYNMNSNTDAMLAQAKVRDCVDDYRRQGYERIQAP